MSNEPPELTTLIIRLPNREAGRLLLRVADLQPIDFPITEPWGYPEPGEAWVRVIIKTSFLPPLDHPLDGDSCYRLDLATLRLAREIRSVPREELIQHAVARLDRPRLVSDFPFGRREADHTWREAVERGEITNPIWLEALRRAGPFLHPDPEFTVRPPGGRRRMVTPDEIQRVRQQALLLRRELLQAGRITSAPILRQPGILDGGGESGGVPIDFLSLHHGDAPHEDRDLLQGVLLMLYVVLDAHLGQVAEEGKTKVEDALSELLVQSVAYQPDKDPVTKRLADCTMRLSALVDRPATPPSASASGPEARDQALAALIKQDRTWVYEHIVLDFFHRY